MQARKLKEQKKAAQEQEYMNLMETNPMDQEERERELKKKLAQNEA